MILNFDTLTKRLFRMRVLRSVGALGSSRKTASVLVVNPFRTLVLVSFLVLALS